MKTGASTSYRFYYRAIVLMAVIIALTTASTQLRADTGMCGGASTTLPFTDVPAANIFFCSIAEAYFSGLTNGTSPTTFSPSAVVDRQQMAAFVTRTMDQSLKRSSPRGALGQWWTPQAASSLGRTTVGIGPQQPKSDGADIWVPNGNFGGVGTVSRVRASDGKLLDTWTGTSDAAGVLIAMGRVFVTGHTNPGRLYQIDPTQPAGDVTTVANNLGGGPGEIAFDGARIWTANDIETGSVSIVTLNPISVTTVSEGFFSPTGIIYDGTNIWVADTGDNKITKLDANGAIIQEVAVGINPFFPVFDGTNIWVPNINGNTVSVVRASTGTVIATLSGNGLNFPMSAAFDGERILVTNNGGNSVSLWKAADLTPIGFLATGANTFPLGVCSDGLNFWVTLAGANQLVRF
jgi:hypothetical protein